MNAWASKFIRYVVQFDSILKTQFDGPKFNSYGVILNNRGKKADVPNTVHLSKKTKNVSILQHGITKLCWGKKCSYSTVVAFWEMSKPSLRIRPPHTIAHSLFSGFQGLGVRGGGLCIK